MPNIRIAASRFDLFLGYSLLAMKIGDRPRLRTETWSDPYYSLSESPKQHAEARLSNADESTHREHHAFHYREDEVRTAVNRRKKALTEKHGNLDTLKIEVKAHA